MKELHSSVEKVVVDTGICQLHLSLLYENVIVRYTLIDYKLPQARLACAIAQLVVLLLVIAEDREIVLLREEKIVVSYDVAYVERWSGSFIKNNEVLRTISHTSFISKGSEVVIFSNSVAK
nr:hypothetical transcript [Hymenolepis microstoma]